MSNQTVIRRMLRRIALGHDAVISYSQEGEDRILLRIFEGERTGFYVDVGAHHPSRFSNTYLLYQLGWRGITIEPRPGSNREFRRLRPRDVHLEVAVSLHPGTSAYYVFSDEALNTTSQERSVQLQDTTAYRLRETLEVPTHRLADILAQHLRPGQPFDLLNVDVEGSDFEVLMSSDWDVYRPRVIVVEDLTLGTLGRPMESSTVAFLHRLGYELVAKSLNSVVFKAT